VNLTKRIKMLLLLASFVSLGSSCSQSANLNGSTGNNQGAGREASGKTGSDNLTDSNGNGQLDSSGAVRETLSDGRIRLTYKGESQVTVNPVDIVFIVDTSGSMSEERIALEQNLNSFLAQIATTASNIDYSAWIIASPFTQTGMANGKTEVLARRVDSNDALRQLRDFVNGTITPAPTKPLRDNSQKQFIVITDDDARGVLAADIVTLATTNQKLLNKTSVNGIIGLVKGSVKAGCSIANVGTQYQVLATNPATKGIILDLCSNDWSQLLGGLAKKIIADTRKSAFDLSERLDVSRGLEVSVGGSAVPTTGYTYEPASSKLTLGAEYAPAAGQELVILYSPLK